jgi:VIT1/CCC1 family predicted Fe2+/Mn2+ transporter
VLVPVTPLFSHLIGLPTSRTRGEKLKVIVDYKRKGDKVIVSHTQLNECLANKLDDLSNFLTNVFTAFIILAVFAIMTTLKVPAIYLLGLILLPLIARGIIYSKVESNLHKKFEDLLSL